MWKSGYRTLYICRRSSKTKRKMERKIGSGRKGTVDEEEYLLKSITKLVVRWTATQRKMPISGLCWVLLDPP